MASSRAAARLTEQHRLAQARLGADTVRRLDAVWPLLDGRNLDGTVARWLRAAVPLVSGQRSASARLAANYYSTFRAVELGVATTAFAPVLAGTTAIRQVTASLTITGPGAVKHHMRIDPIVDRAMQIGRSMSASAGMRHALDGGRDTITQSIHEDDAALGHARATSGQPCAFCAMLASRGPVYTSEESASFEPHDGCQCEPEPVFHRGADWPDGSRDLREQWDAAQREAAAGGDLQHDTANDALNAFRRSLGR